MRTYLVQNFKKADIDIFFSPIPTHIHDQICASRTRFASYRCIYDFKIVLFFYGLLSICTATKTHSEIAWTHKETAS